MFLDTIHELLCHGQARVSVHAPGILRCMECDRSFSVYDFLTDEKSMNVFVSSALARQYCEWTGDSNVPCLVPIVNIPGIVSTNVRTTLHRVQTATRLLRILNQPFVPDRSLVTGVDRENLFKHFMSDYLNLIQSFSDDSHIVKTVQAILIQMKESVRMDLFEHYFNLVIPYIENCQTEPVSFPIPPPDDDDESPARSFLEESRLSTEIRARFAPYCIPFDVVYVMIYCYLCDTNAIANFVFDLAARVCRGYFKVPGNRYEQQLIPILNATAHYRKNPDLHHVVKNIGLGEAEACLSIDFLNKYTKLNELVSKRFFMQQGGETEASRFAYAQNYPYVLFKTDSDYYGFVLALGHLLSGKSKTTVLEKGELAQARAMYRFVKRFMTKMTEYDVRYWTEDQFTVFLNAEVGLEQEFLNVVKMLMGQSPA